MQVQAHLTETDYSKFRRYALFRIRKSWLLLVAFVPIFAWEIFPKGHTDVEAVAQSFKLLGIKSTAPSPF